MSSPYCTICYGIYAEVEAIASTPCGHLYHNSCMAEWLGASETCPQCRENCNSSQLKRIFIDFERNETLAKAKEVLQATVDNLQIENKRIAQSLNIQECENKRLNEEIQLSSKRIEDQAIEMSDCEYQLREIKERLDTSEKCLAAIQTENIQMQDTINMLNEDISVGKTELLEKTKKLQVIHELFNEFAVKLGIDVTEHDVAEQVLNKWEKMMSDMKDNIIYLNGFKRGIEERLKEKFDTCENIETEGGEIKPSSNDMEQKCVNLVNVNQKMMERIKDLEEKISIKSTALQETENDVNVLNEQLKAMKIQYGETDCSNVTNSLKDKEQEDVNLVDSNQTGVKQIVELKNNHGSNEHTLNELNERLDASEKRVATLELEKVEKEDTISKLQTRISYNEMELKAMDKDMLIAYDKLKQMTIKCDDVESERIKLEHSLNDKQQENERLLEEHQKALKGVEDLQKTISLKDADLNQMYEKFRYFERQNLMPMCGRPLFYPSPGDVRPINQYSNPCRPYNNAIPFNNVMPNQNTCSGMFENPFPLSYMPAKHIMPNQAPQSSLPCTNPNRASMEHSDNDNKL